ncbi:MAG: GNAT family N-acetyltransferase [Bacteroidales bacterium]
METDIEYGKPGGLRIHEVSKHDGASLEAVRGLFEEMYAEMTRYGLMLPLAEDGGQKWAASIKNNLGRFGTLILATKEDMPVGFAYGALSMAPNYLVAGKTGVVTHIFVVKKERSGNLGSRMLSQLEQWFRSMQVHSVELQVLAHNAQGIAFWERSGYAKELMQYRKKLRDG